MAQAMGKRLIGRAAVAALLAALVPASADQPAAFAATRTAKQRLRAFASCPALIRYGEGHAAREQRSGGRRGLPTFGQPVAVGAPGRPNAPAPTTTSGTEDSSRTNVQEAGVDEPDIVKTDGSRIFAVAGNRLHAVDGRARTPRLLDSLPIEGYGHELLIDEGKALVVSHVYAGTAQPTPQPSPRLTQPAYAPPATLLTEVDVSRPGALRILRTERVEGSFLTARLAKGTARLVLVTRPRALEQGGERLRSRVSGWLPYFELNDRRTGRKTVRRAASCRAVTRAPVFSGLDVVTVLTVDLSKGLPAVDADAVLSDAQTVYASPASLYVASEKWIPAPSSPQQVPPRISTALHRFDISSARSTAYRSSGEVPGFVLNQFSFSEHGGVLRVATTDQPPWWGGGARPQSQSFVTVLDERAGALVEVGRVGGLGHGERIYAVRFIGDAGFVVTFRQTDPLYTIDLSNPARPRVRGELKILGYSAYLHPVGGDLLLGVGQDATEQGRTLGTQLSLFDVSDLARPVRLHSRKVGSSAFSHSEAEYDHHAFLYWAPTRLTVIPVQLYGGQGRPFVGALGFRIARASGIDEAGRVSHRQGDQDSQIRRSLVVANRLFTMSDTGLKASHLADLSEYAWVPFPVPPSPPTPEPVPVQPAR
jgi:beta propeller domain-containing protein